MAAYREHRERNVLAPMLDAEEVHSRVIVLVICFGSPHWADGRSEADVETQKRGKELS